MANDPDLTPTFLNDPWNWSRYVPRYDPETYQQRLGDPLPLLADLFPRPGLTLLAAPPKSGKTSFATALAWAVATGTPFAGRPVQKAPAVYVDFESSGPERRFDLAGLPLAEHPDHAFHHATGLPYLGIPEWEWAFDWMLNDLGAGLVVIDSLRAAACGRRIDRSEVARELVGGLAKAAGVTSSGVTSSGGAGGATVLLLHHTNAYETRPADSPQLLAAAGSVARLTSAPDPEDERARTVTLDLAGRGLVVGGDGRRTVRFASAGPLDYRAPAPLVSILPRPENSGPLPVETAAELLLALLEPVADREPPDSATLGLWSGLNLGTVRNALTRLMREGRAVATRRGRGFVYRKAPGKITPDPAHVLA